MSEVLETRTKTVDDSLVERRHPEGHRVLMRGDRSIASDGEADLARAARFAIDLKVARGAAVAIIGGGLCVLPRVLRGRGYTQHVYEIEPALDRYCPDYATFIPGDYRTTLTGLYDAIVYDLGDPADTALLNAHLNPGGLLLGVE
jgi:hypothetical protein